MKAKARGSMLLVNPLVNSLRSAKVGQTALHEAAAFGRPIQARPPNLKGTHMEDEQSASYMSLEHGAQADIVCVCVCGTDQGALSLQTRHPGLHRHPPPPPPPPRTQPARASYTPGWVGLGELLARFLVWVSTKPENTDLPRVTHK